MERQTIPPLVWPSQSQLEHFFSSINVDAIPFQKKQHELPTERKSELLQALGSTSASIIRLDDPGSTPAIAALFRDHDVCGGPFAPSSVESLIRSVRQRTGFHITDRLTYSVLSGHYITRPDLLPFPAHYDRWAGRNIDVTQVFPRERSSFSIALALDDDEYAPENFMFEGSRMHTLLMDVGVDLTDHERSMAEDYVLLGIDLSGYKEYEMATGLGGLVYSTGPFLYSALPPPPKYVTPLALLKETHEGHCDLFCADLPKL